MDVNIVKSGLEVINLKLIEFFPKLILAIAILFIGFKVANLLAKLLNKVLTKKELDLSLISFLTSITKTALKVAVFISAIGLVGVKTSSFVALLASAGLAVGLALQGSLSNFAGGVMILLFRPFKIGDFIDAVGQSGTVRSINIFHTILTTGDNKTIIIPNGKLANDTITNVSAERLRRVDWTFGIGYNDNIDSAKKIIRTVLDKHPDILNEPQPFVAVSALADSSVNLVTRAWVEKDNYWPVHFAILEEVKNELDSNGITIPYPQSELHIRKLNQIQ